MSHQMGANVRPDEVGVIGHNPPSDSGRASLPPRFTAYIARLAATSGDGRGLGRYPDLDAKPWHDASSFPLARRLEANAAAILRELRGVGEGEFVPEREPIGRRGRWDVAFFYERGRTNETMRARCPATFAAIESERIVRGPSGLAYLSRLAASTHIAPHRGPTNVRVRCHFGVDVPEDCGLRVDGVAGGWAEGRCVVFDDSFVHEAWNRDVRDRIVFIVDLWHPDLSDAEVALLAGLDVLVADRAANLSSYYARNRA